MEVRPGYKQTEVGVIPEEWDDEAARSARRITDRNTYRPARRSDHGTLVLGHRTFKRLLRLIDKCSSSRLAERAFGAPHGDDPSNCDNAEPRPVGKCALLQRTDGMTFALHDGRFAKPESWLSLSTFAV